MKRLLSHSHWMTTTEPYDFKRHGSRAFPPLVAFLGGAATEPIVAYLRKRTPSLLLLLCRTRAPPGAQVSLTANLFSPPQSVRFEMETNLRSSLRV